MGVEIERIYDGIRQRQREALERRTREIYAAVPELAAFPERRRDVFRALAAREIGTREASAMIRSLKEQEERLLREHRFEPDALELRYSCEKCRDTGWTDKAGRRPCSCRLLIRAKNDPGIGINDRETFERFSSGIFPDAEQRRRTLNARKWCEQYADALPLPSRRNVLLMGMTGLGKSYLCNAIAYRALENGVDVQKATSYRFVQDALAAIGERRNGVDSRYLTVPLLILDDLGSEPVIPNVTEEAFFNVLNERISGGLPTVFATNLSAESLEDKYGERVTSRILDGDACQIIRLTGSNLRLERVPC